MSDATNTLESYNPPVVDDRGKFLDERIKDVGAARSLWFRLQQADLKSNQQMAKVQAMVDGAPPLDQMQLAKQGLAYMSNFNPGDAKAVLDTSLAAFYDLISGTESLIDLRTKYGSEQERQEWSQKMSLNMSRVIRRWPQFNFKYSYIPHYMVLHGVGIAYFQDPLNWEWDVTNLAYFKIPRQTRANEAEIQYACLKKLENPADLMKYINMGEIADEQGWDRDQLKKAIMNASEQIPDMLNWMEWEARWKDNDITYGETSPSISVIYMWVQELDGSYSMYAFAENGYPITDGVPENFLFKRRHLYRNASEAFTFFTRGIGTNGNYHGIRGLGSDMFNAFQQLMRLENKKVDVAQTAGPHWQVESEEAVENFRIVPYGAGYLVTPGANFVQVQQPNIIQNIEPAVQSLRQTFYNNIAQYTSSKTLDTGRELSKFEAMSRMEMASQLSVTSINLFMQPFDRLMNEVGRRFLRPGYQRGEPGGEEVWQFRQMCLEDGIPEEALKNMDLRYTRASRSIGFGSPSARRLAYENLMPMYPYYDEYGKQTLIRNFTGAIAGWQMADELTTPAGANQRPPIDAAIADAQNAILAQGATQAIMPNENKSVHLQTHIAKLTEFYQQFDQAGQNPEMYAQIVPPMSNIFDHAAQTLEQFTGPEAPQFRQQLQQFNEIIVNGSRHLQKQQAMEAEASGQPQEDQGPSEIEMKMAEWRAKMDQRSEEFRMKMEQRQADAAQARALKDTAAAAAIALKGASYQAQQASIRSSL
jgi:hypothetical protein